jgi:tRNA-2-methylthio-N6-dimethylallyladenosine synthase
MEISEISTTKPMNTSDLGKVYIETYGCQMNEYDSGLIASLSKESGL